MQITIPEKKKVRFVHIADVHLGAFKEQHERLRKAGLDLLKMVVEFCERYKVDFILISGDLFDKHLPPLELQKECAAVLTGADERGIRVYVVYGSHDASPTHNSYVDVLAATKRIRQVEKKMKSENGKISLVPVEDISGIRIVGMRGMKGGTEVNYMEELDFENIEKIPRPRIFMLHSAITEFRPDFLKEEGVPLSIVPRNFDYYACGHVHKRIVQYKEGYGLFVYPGALFGSNVRDLEEATEHLPGFYIVDFEGKAIAKEDLTFIDVYSLQTMLGKNETPDAIPDIMYVEFTFETATPGNITSEIKKWAKEKDLKDTIVYLKINGRLEEGRRSQINVEEIARILKDRGAIEVLPNKEGIVEKKESVIVQPGGSLEDIERKVVEEFFRQKEEVERALQLLNVLGVEREQGESEKDYKNKIWENVKKELGLEGG